MKVLLMHPERDFDVQAPLPPQADTLIQNLALDTLFDAMAGGDDFLRVVARVGLLQSLDDAREITWRQQALDDCDSHRLIIETLYKLALATVENERRQMHFWSHDTSGGNLSEGVETLQRCLAGLHALREIADDQARGSFHSPAFLQFFAALRSQLDDGYLALIAAQLKELHFQHGMMAGARVGSGGKSVGWVLHQTPAAPHGGWRHWFGHEPQAFAFEIAPRDEAGSVALNEVRNRALEVAAAAVAQAAGQVMAFFGQLRIELGFYRGALRLKDALRARGMPVCRPDALAPATHGHEARGLYDPCLCLAKDSAVTGNDLAAPGVDLVFVTGANQGGKSTFLRSLGTAQLLLQAGLFVPAERFCANLCSGLFTHYKREEDAGMASGKFDEELVRMDAIVEHMAPGALMLFNESFAATNEREGAAIAAEIIEALIDKQVMVVFVTHFYELPRHFGAQAHGRVLFLGAERGADGSRTHRIVPGRPSRTAHGQDLYARIFADGSRAPDER